MHGQTYAAIIEEILNTTWRNTVNGRSISRLTPDLMTRFVQNLNQALQHNHKRASIVECGDWWLRIRYRGRSILAEYDFEDEGWFAEVIQ